MSRTYHKDMTLPTSPAIFVFGSNLSGIHGAGSAKIASDKFGARFGNGVGYTGSCYAIPTKSAGITRSLTLSEIKLFVDAFICASNNSKTIYYFITRVGCGLAGYNDSQIAPMFRGCGDNCSFPEEWKPYLE